MACGACPVELWYRPNSGADWQSRGTFAGRADAWGSLGSVPSGCWAALPVGTHPESVEDEDDEELTLTFTVAK